MRHIVIDTNCLIQMISLHSPYRPIWNAFLLGKFKLCISNEILEEYQEIIEQQTTARIAENIILLILNRRNVTFVDPHFRLGLIAEDPDDNKFVDCAFAANADYLVSNDKHFDILKRTSFPSLNLIRMSDFLSVLPNL
ncbi:MAG: putative toxin-antitoxin system toxin component, PIN family [Prevotella sp.]|nr:putative toxin-antitoxin system toxin component, PIN family [Prevotella sp.]